MPLLFAASPERGKSDRKKEEVREGEKEREEEVVGLR